MHSCISPFFVCLVLCLLSVNRADEEPAPPRKKDDTEESIAKYDGKWAVEVHESSAIEGDHALVLQSKAKHHAVSVELSRPIRFDTPEIVIQYEVKFADGLDCGGAYIKLLSETPTLQLFHFILRYKNKKTGEYEEKHAKKVSADIAGYFSDKRTHVYTLVLRRDNTFERFIDLVSVQRGNLLKDLEPAINPPSEIDDPSDKRPDDWDERQTISDPSAQKPDDWDETAPEFITNESATKPEGWLDDEPEMIPDPEAQKPADWDTEVDGDWEAPLIKNKQCESAPGCGEWQKPKMKNPEYKGKWSAPIITNPAYKGVWKPKNIPNPDFFNDEEPYTSLDPVSALGIEVWSMNENIVFDNFIITDSLKTSQNFAAQTWSIKNDAERLADPRAHSVVDAIRENYKEQPFVVLGIGFAFALPLLFCFWYIWRLATRTPVSSMHKKTDSATPDDAEPTKYDDTTPKSKSTVPPQEDTGEDEEVETEEDSIDAGEQDEEDEDIVAVDETPDVTPDSDSNEVVKSAQPSKNVRKRRPRKE